MPVSTIHHHHFAHPRTTLSTSNPPPTGLVDVFGWGALGHAFGYFLLAASSLNDAGGWCFMSCPGFPQRGLWWAGGLPWSLRHVQLWAT